MSEKDKEKEKEKEEEIIIDHSCHGHPLALTQKVRSSYLQCYGCTRYIFSKETAYTCREGCSNPIFHEECAEMPQEITHSMHPQHALLQKEVMHVPDCAFCEKRIIRNGYYCTSAEPCEFQIHVGCARSTDIIHVAATGERSCMKHPSHPQHELTLLWMPGRAGSLRCNACGSIQRGNSYTCTVCQYFVHESCAALPPTLTCQHHDHPLSLVYGLPQEYAIFGFPCNVCYMDLLPKNWAYHCGICRYIVHVKCASRTLPAITSNIDATAFLIKNAVEELIEAFVAKSGEMVNIQDEKEMVKLGKYKFHNPDHQLRLISSSSEEEEEDGITNCSSNSDDDEEEDLYHEKVSKLVCDVCTEPIIILSEPRNEKKEKKKKTKYISCEESECKFYVHVACFQLPGEIASSHIHKPDHVLTLKTRTSKLRFPFCTSCRVNTNGLFYECTDTSCYFKADVKCVSLPATIKHAAHRQHLLNLLNDDTTSESSYGERRCGACGLNTIYEVCYRCDICGVIFHSRCCLLPQQIINRRYDKHPLRLTFDATLNHPGEFYCDVCEQKMNPRMWMYHCRQCDVSVHPGCFPSVSDMYRNVKFGGRYLALNHHPHTLRFQPLTNSRKPRCDVCRHRIVYGTRGFQCSSSDCDFFMCYDGHSIAALQAVDS